MLKDHLTASRVWLPRWTGDALARAHQSGRRLHPAVGAGMVGLALSFAVYTVVSHYWDRPHLQEELDTLGDNRRLLLQEGLTDFEQLIELFVDHFQSSTRIPRGADIPHCNDKVRQSLSSIGIVAWIPRVAREDRAAHEAQVAHERSVGYHIGDVTPTGDLTPAADRDAYFPLLQVCGELRVASSPGLDLGANEAVRQALDRARDRDEPSGSGLVHLGNGPDSQPLFVLALPVYSAGLPDGTAEERRQNLIGFAGGVVDPGKLLDSILRKVKSPQGLDIQFLDAGSGPNDRAFHVRSSLLRTVPAEIRSRGELEAGLHWSGRLNFGGAQWDMVVVTIPHAPLLVAHDRAWIILIAGLILTGATVTYTWYAQRINARLTVQIRQREMAERSRVADLERFRLIFESVSDAIFVVNPQTGAFIDVNPAASTMLGFPRDEIIGSTIATFSSGVPPYTLADAVTQLGKGQTTPFEWHCKTKNDQLFWAEISQRGASLEGRPVILAILRDVTERKRHHEEVAHLAHFDTLTGLPNRLDFDATLEQEIARCGRYDRPLCMAIGDIDHFKLVNDTFGHPAGDVVLKTLAQLMRDSLRNADYIARWGGEEFTILLPETNLDDAEELLNRIRVAISDHVIPEIGRPATLSFGVTAYAKPDSPDDLLERVDRALYMSKETGRNKVTKLRSCAVEASSALT